MGPGTWWSRLLVTVGVRPFSWAFYWNAPAGRCRFVMGQFGPLELLVMW